MKYKNHVIEITKFYTEFRARVDGVLLDPIYFSPAVAEERAKKFIESELPYEQSNERCI